MRFFCIKPKQVFHKVFIRVLDIIQFLILQVNQLFFQSSIKSFNKAITLGVFWVSKIMGQILVFYIFSEVFFKFFFIIFWMPFISNGGTYLNFSIKSFPDKLEGFYIYKQRKSLSQHALLLG